MARRDQTLYRDENEKILGGVCSGIGQYFDIDTNLVRVGFVMLGAFGGAGALGYLILWAILDPKPVDPQPLPPETTSTMPDIVLEEPIALPDQPATPPAATEPQGETETSGQAPPP